MKQGYEDVDIKRLQFQLHSSIITCLNIFESELG